MEMYDSKKQPRGVLYIEKKQKMWKEREKKKKNKGQTSFAGEWGH